MNLFIKTVKIIGLSLALMIIGVSSIRNIGDNLNLSSTENIENVITTVIKSEEDNNEKEVINNDNKDNDNSNNDETNNDDLVELEIADTNEQSESSEEDSIVEEDNRDVVYYRNDITIVSKITKEEMEEVLLTYKGASTMAHLAEALVDAEREYGVNAFAIAGIVALESGFATSRRAVEDNNLTGYEVYSDDSQGRLFSSQYESIMQTAKHLSNNYLKEGGTYYKGVSVDAVQLSYCPDKKYNWHNKVDMLATGFLRVYKGINSQN